MFGSKIPQSWPNPPRGAVVGIAETDRTNLGVSPDASPSPPNPFPPRPPSLRPPPRILRSRRRPTERGKGLSGGGSRGDHEWLGLLVFEGRVSR